MTDIQVQLQKDFDPILSSRMQLLKTMSQSWGIISLNLEKQHLCAPSMFRRIRLLNFNKLRINKLGI